MSFKQFTGRVTDPTKDINGQDIIDLQRDLEYSLNEVFQKKHLDSIFLETVVLESAWVNLVSHGLGQEWRSFYILGSTNPAIIGIDDTDVDTTKYLPLITTVNTTIDLVVFK